MGFLVLTQKLISQPFLLGVGGNSGVGKTTLSNALSKLFFPSNSVVIKGDDMHRWKRGDKIETIYSFRS